MIRSRIKVADLAKGSSNEYLAKLANEQVKTIDTLIQVSNKDGKDRVEYDLPSVVDTPTMTQSDAQLILYSMIVKAYDANNFNVKLSKSGRITVIWSNNLLPNEREQLQGFLKQFVD